MSSIHPRGLESFLEAILGGVNDGKSSLATIPKMGFPEFPLGEVNAIEKKAGGVSTKMLSPCAP
jgi:hypothetical protein